MIDVSVVKPCSESELEHTKRKRGHMRSFARAISLMVHGHMIPGGVETNPRLRRSRAASTPSPRTFNTACPDESGRVDLLVYNKPHGGRDMWRIIQNTINSASH